MVNIPSNQRNLGNVELMLKVFIGYDPREDLAYQVCSHSILRYSRNPISIYPLKQSTLRELGLYSRMSDPSASTEFSLTRFLTPYLSAHDGWSLFLDCDFLLTKDVTELALSLDQDRALHVVQHDYTPRSAVKMDGAKQTVYPRKNWSSFMLFNGCHPAVKALTPPVVNNQSPAYLHRFEWLNDSEIGELGQEWNFLVGEYSKPENLPCAIHFTNGGPWFGQNNVDYADLWLAERAMWQDMQ
jgi:lipopolysaccharide biosynthesis glycosyltransferase